MRLIKYSDAPAEIKARLVKLTRNTGDYSDLAIEPIDFIAANNLGFCEGNILKYIARWKAKNGVEDLKKARWYIDFLIESIENETDKI